MKDSILIFTVWILAIGCNENSNQNSMFESLKQKNKTDEFWNWFTENRIKFEKIDSTNRDEKLDLILSQLHKITSGLAVEISDEFKGIRDFVISPDGDKEKFALVKEIISRAPAIKGWTFTAFRQPINEDFTLKYKDLEFTPSKMFFLPKIDGDSLDLIIYTENIKNHDVDKIAYYGLITMDNVLGEYDCVLKVRHYDFHDLDEVENKNDLIHLTELKTFVGNFHRQKQKKTSI